MPIPTTFKVDYSKAYGRDLSSEAIGRSLDMMRGKPVYEAILNAFSSEVQELYNAAIDLLICRSLYDANGVWIDAIARIVGARKLPEDSGQAYDFLWAWVKNGDAAFEEVTDISRASSDTTVAWVKNAPDNILVLPSAGAFRTQILARIMHNATQNCSLPELSSIVRLIFGINCYVQRTGPMQIKIWVPSSATNSVQYFLKYHSSLDARVDRIWYMPYPATIEVDAGSAFAEFRFASYDKRMTFNSAGVQTYPESFAPVVFSMGGYDDLESSEAWAEPSVIPYDLNGLPVYLLIPEVLENTTGLERTATISITTSGCTDSFVLTQTA